MPDFILIEKIMEHICYDLKIHKVRRFNRYSPEICSVKFYKIFLIMDMKY